MSAGSSRPGATGPALDLAAAGHGDKGDTIAVEATPRDVYGPGATRTSAAATVLNSAPVIGSAQALPADVVEGDEVAFDATATDADGDPLTIRWAFGEAHPDAQA